MSPASTKATDLEQTRAAASVASSMRRRADTFLIVAALITFLCDIGTKEWVLHHLPGPLARHDLWQDHLALVIAKNFVGSWGMTRSMSDGPRRWFFLAASLSATAVIVAWNRRLPTRHWALRWALPIVLGGVIGNEVDRLHRGYVLDFIQLRVALVSGDRVWSTCNVADIAIRIGVLLAGIDLLLTVLQQRTRAAT